jgi:hypothetical protein
MRDTFKKTLTAVVFAMFVALPFGAHAADVNNNATITAKGSVKEILADIRSDPKGIDGEVIKSAKVLPFGNKDTTVASCWYCDSWGCTWIC